MKWDRDALVQMIEKGKLVLMYSPIVCQYLTLYFSLVYGLNQKDPILYIYTNTTITYPPVYTCVYTVLNLRSNISIELENVLLVHTDQ